MNGNEALAYGLIAAGVRFGAAYPITPWSDVMEILRRELPKYGGIFVQCEDEIASICMALGGSYAGRVAVTGSSGPGLSLKTEALGWGVMAEMPLVIIDVQRGGPSTGLPTNVEQSDLNIAVYGGHGDAPRVVIAPADVEDCFYTAIEAVNIARQYSVPVIILSDQAIADAHRGVRDAGLGKGLPGTAARPDAGGGAQALRSVRAGWHHPPQPPGTRIANGIYPIATGLEHDELRAPVRLAEGASDHERQAPQEAAEARDDACRRPRFMVQPEGEVLLVGWGSTQGPIKEAVDRLRAEGFQRFLAAHPQHQPAAARARARSSPASSRC